MFYDWNKFIDASMKKPGRLTAGNPAISLMITASRVFPSPPRGGEFGLYLKPLNFNEKNHNFQGINSI